MCASILFLLIPILFLSRCTTTIKPPLHERFLSRVGDAISDFVALPARQGGYTCDKFGNKSKAMQITYFKRSGHYKQTFFVF